MMVDREDTGTAGTQHFDRRSPAETHFFEPMDELGLAFEVVDRAPFAGLKEFQWKDLHHGIGPHRVTAGD